jgi:serine phosphatase RsbU (regulator of sigma subunit)
VGGLPDFPRHQVTIANAGHLPPLLVSSERTEFVAAPTGPPIGVPVVPPYSATVVPIPAGATLLAYTDGLVERREETLDDGLRRLYDTAVAADLGGEALIDRLMSTLAPEGCDDDTAILGLQWQE